MLVPVRRIAAVLLLSFGFLATVCISQSENELVPFSGEVLLPYLNTIPDYQTPIISSNDTTIQISFSSYDTEREYAIWISDAEVQELTIDDQVYYTGKYQNTRKLEKSWDYRHFYISGAKINNKKATARLSNYTTASIHIYPVLYTSDLVDQQLVEIIGDSKIGILFTIFFLGGILIFFIYTIGQVIQTGNIDFKYYAYYLGAILLHNSLQADAFLKIFAFFPNNPIWYHHLNEFFQMFIYVFFMLFLKVFLELKDRHPKINTFINVSIYATILFAFVFLFTAIIFKNFLLIQNELSILWLVVATLGTIVVIRVYRSSTNPTRYYILAGSIFLLIGSIMELYFSLDLAGGYNWNLYAVPDNSWYPFNYTQLAILCETVCFALGIGYKIRQKEQLLIKYQEKEIEQLHSESEIKDSEIQTLADSIKSEKSLREETTHMLELLESKYGVMEYQLNPHFLFNNLNAINNLIMHGKDQEASKYLVSFSRLIRDTINKSKDDTISLSDEVELTRKYLTLEQKRLVNGFDFEIIAPDLIPSQILIPPFLSQRYIEYILWNRILTSDAEVKKLSIHFLVANQSVIIKVEDNGSPSQNDPKGYNDILESIESRLELIYGEDSFLVDYSHSENKNILRLEIPKSQRKNSLVS